MIYYDNHIVYTVYKDETTIYQSLKGDAYAYL